MYRVGFKKDWVKDLEPGGGKVMVELTGYIPVQRRIQQIMDAGHRLVEHRTAENYFHFKPGEEPDLTFENYVGQKNYDPADATQDLYRNKARLAAQTKEFEEKRNKLVTEKAAAEAAQKPPQGA